MAVPDAARKSPRPVPTTGLRGGLGRTLLTAFLILAIGPLGLVSYLAFDRARNDQRQRALERLTIVADLISVELQDWAEGEASSLALISTGSANTVPEVSIDIAATYYRDFESIWLVKTHTRQTWPVRLASDASMWANASVALVSQLSPPQLATLIVDPDGTARFAIVVPITGPDTSSTFCLVGVIRLPERFSKGWSSHDQHLYLLEQSGQLFYLDGQAAPASLLSPVARTDKDGQGLYTNHQDVPVFGAYRRLTRLGCTLVAEQDQASVFAASDQFAANLIAAMLGVALLTAVIAAVVTRQLTRPIVRLTEVALLMAEGDLSQRVQTDRHDEIGILAHVFNKMTTDLGELYSGLEKKVAERTRELQEAKEQIQYHAWQLSISTEVGRITTSILELDTLLERASHLIRDAFQLDHVGIYLLDGSGEIAVLRKNAGRAVPAYERQIHVSGSHPVSRAISGRIPHAGVQPGSRDTPGACQRLALPLIVGAKVIGALELTSYDPVGFSDSEQSVLQTLADQLSVAIQNARAYGYEREVIDDMREVDRLRGQFLSRISHELATYLNNIIGFSQVLLKGMDGPLTELQVRDMTVIQQSGQQLLQLLNDIHELANLEVGAIDLHITPVDLTGVIEGVQTAMAETLVDLHLGVEKEPWPDLPPVLADAGRLRQVLINLIIAAAETSPGEAVAMRVKQVEGQIHFVVSVTATDDTPKGRSSIHLAISRRLIELHGARLRVAQQASGETVFAFNLPINPKL